MIFRSLYPDVAIPERALHSCILEKAPERRHKPALIDRLSGRTLTYAQLAASTKILAASLAQRGFGKGEVLAILSPNLPEYALTFLGVASAAGVITTINPL